MSRTPEVAARKARLPARAKLLSSAAPAADPSTADTAGSNPIRGGPPIAALSLEAFCRSHGISLRFFFALQKQGKAPKVMKVGRRRLVSIEAATQWRRQMEDSAA